MYIVGSVGRWPLTVMLLVGVTGCAKSEPGEDILASFNSKPLVPVTGIVTIKGRPMRSIVVTFLPSSGPGLGHGETDQDGKYELETNGRPGVAPGEYKVTISLLVSTKGKPQGLDARSGFDLSRDVLSGKEQMPPEYWDAGRTKLSAAVGPQGGTFNFDLPVELPILEKLAAEARSSERETALEKQPPAGKTSKDKE